jgi:hypothetical protein
MSDVCSTFPWKLEPLFGKIPAAIIYLLNRNCLWDLKAWGWLRVHWCEVSEDILLWALGMLVITAWSSVLRLYILLNNLLFRKIDISFQFYLVGLKISRVCDLKEIFLILEDIRELNSEKPNLMQPHGTLKVALLSTSPRSQGLEVIASSGLIFLVCFVNTEVLSSFEVMQLTL